MPAGQIRVGIIGVEPGRSWGAIAHIPALRALGDYEITALSNRSQASAEAAAAVYGIPKAHGTAAALVNDPDVDLVAVTVKVPHHLELVTAAIQAGKSVYCEWPLGNGLEEASQMAELARSHNVHAVVGLQARVAPAVSYIRELIRQGYVGEVLSTTLVGSGMNWGAVMETPNAYTVDKTNGATVLTIPFAHTVDALCSVLGEFRDLTALLARRRTSTTIVETGASLEMTAEDQVVVAGTLASGTVASIHYRGGMTRGTGLLWEINGSEGDLQVTAVGGHAQIFDLGVRGVTGKDSVLQTLEVPSRHRWAPPAPGPAFNVAQAYAMLAADMRDGTRNCPTFDHGVVRHRLIAAVEQSAATGRRVSVQGSD